LRTLKIFANNYKSIPLVDETGKLTPQTLDVYDLQLFLIKKANADTVTKNIKV